MKQVVFTRERLTQMIDEFIDSRDNREKDEYYATQEEIARDVMDEFIEYHFKQKDDKAKRYAEYLKLKAEFE